MDNKLYNKDSIESLSPLEFTRLKPGVYAGDTTYSTQLSMLYFTPIILLVYCRYPNYPSSFHIGAFQCLAPHSLCI